MVDYGVYTDLELSALLKQRDKTAFTIIYNRYWRLIYAHIYKMLRDEEEAKDLLQEIFSQLWTKAEDMPHQDNLAGYLYVTARHRVLNIIRQQKFRSDYIASLAQFIDEASEATLQYLDERDLMAAIEKEIQALPPRMKQVFEMSRKENLSYKEIGQLLGTSGETVKKQINKSLKVIRLNLKESGVPAILLLVLWRS